MDVREADFTTLEPDIRRLCESSERASVFQSWEWLDAWHRFGGGRNKKHLSLVFTEEGRAVGVAPLVVTRGPLQTLTLMGQGSSDYLDILASPGKEEAIRSAFAQWLGENRRRWDWLDMQQVRPGAAIEGLPGADVWEGETCPHLPLERSWEAQKKAFPRKLRSNIGYYERALEKSFALTMRLASEETLERDMEAFFALHQKRWRGRFMPGAFASARAREFHLAAARALLSSGRLRLHLLDLDGKVAAALYCFHKGPATSYYLSGFEPTLARFSLGTVLTARAIRHAIESDGAAEFDFLRGDEPYKYRWGALDRKSRRLSLASGPLGRALAGVGKKLLAAELALKHRMHAAHGGKEKGER